MAQSSFYSTSQSSDISERLSRLRRNIKSIQSLINELVKDYYDKNNTKYQESRNKILDEEEKAKNAESTAALKEEDYHTIEDGPYYEKKAKDLDTLYDDVGGLEKVSKDALNEANNIMVSAKQL